MIHDGFLDASAGLFEKLKKKIKIYIISHKGLDGPVNKNK